MVSNAIPGSMRTCQPSLICSHTLARGDLLDSRFSGLPLSRHYFFANGLAFRMAANGLGIILFRYANWLHGRGYCRNTIHQYTWRAKRHPFSQSIRPSEIAEFLTSHLSRCRCPQPAVTTLQTCRPRINHFPFLLLQRRYLVHKRLLEEAGNRGCEKHRPSLSG